jgi:hypothetical protein
VVYVAEKPVHMLVVPVREGFGKGLTVTDQVVADGAVQVNPLR